MAINFSLKIWSDGTPENRAAQQLTKFGVLFFLKKGLNLRLRLQKKDMMEKWMGQGRSQKRMESLKVLSDNSFNMLPLVCKTAQRMS